jgi:secreted PhoX family phosphatase
MQDMGLSGGGYSDGDVDTNFSANEHLNALIETRYSRREAMSGIGAAAAAVFGSSLLAACDDEGGTLPADGTVSAGQNGATTTGRIVQLVGSTQGGSFGTVSWEQTGGPAVTLTNAGTLNASFIAPAVAAATPLTFRFSGRSATSGAVITADTTVTVSPAVLSFNAVAKSLTDIVSVPAGYTVTILYRGGDPLAANVPAFANDGTDTNWAQRAGDHHDGMYWYGLNAAGTARDDNGSERGLLVMNHENLNQPYLHPNGPTGNGTTTPRPEAEAIKEIEAHGVSVVEVRRQNNVWSYNQASPFNARVTPNTPVVFNGPVRGNAALRTAFSPDGTQGRGTVNNCAFGFYLWFTFATCEENWAGYFRRATGDDANRSARELTSLRRYGIPQGASGSYGWASVTPANAGDTSYRRWNITVDTTRPADGTGDFRNEHNQFGWVVEIDPYDKTKAPRKRTALGRMGHEGAWHGQWVSGRKVTVYLGDDARNEYFYKFISNNAWNPADAQSADRLGIGDKYLDNGTLYVAKFNANGTGTWLPLVFGQVPNRPADALGPVYVFQDQADILINARLAADALGATKMDRPEWTATQYQTGEIYLTLTNNNTLRGQIGTDGPNPRNYNDPKLPGTGTNPTGNPNGHILRLRETGDNSESLTFSWDIYLFGAGSDLDATNINLSSLDASNDFSSPDGIWFARPTNPSGLINPLLWIQSDDGAFTDQTNNQMLCALPGRTGDGGQRTITNVNGQQTTFVGAAPGVRLKRFMVGPKECELTGVDTTPDGRTLFVNVQHPGENGGPANITSNWPQSQSGQASGRPRSATIVVTKDDGGIVGL